MILLIDIGNSNIVLGGFENGKLIFFTRIATEHKLEADQYAVQLQGILELYGLQNKPIEKVMISSVVASLTNVLCKALTHFTKNIPEILSLEYAKNINIAIDNPKELGMDILASVIAVSANYDLPAVIIDMGTATKIIALNKGNVLEGVAIAPGLYLSISALVQGTSTLNGIEIEAPKKAIGKNTRQSMQSGLVFGSAAMIDGMIDLFAKEMGEVKTIIATGGAAPLVVPYCTHEIIMCEHLLLDGLYRASSATL